jgi:heme exporter protein CcmD
MDFAASHVGFVLASYGLALAALAVLTVSVWLRYRRTARQLAELEASGAPRRRKTRESGP